MPCEGTPAESPLSVRPLPRPDHRTGACVVIAEFQVKPEALGDFWSLACRFAEECLQNERGCRQFEVVQLETTPHGVLFYEGYDNAAAFEAHCGSAHLARFKAHFPPLIIGERPLRRGVT